MKNTIKYTAILSAILLPAVSFAALTGLIGLLREIQSIIGIIQPIVIALALVYFFWGVGQFILNDAGSDKTREEGKKKMIWGVVALFVMFSIMGIISTLSDLTGIPTTATGTTAPLLNNSFTPNFNNSFPTANPNPSSVPQQGTLNPINPNASAL